MEARILGAARPLTAAAIALAACPLISTWAQAAGYRTPNFVVDAPTPELAREIGESAERWRVDLAEEWLGQTLPRWAEPCPIKARVAPNLGAGGATSFVFDRGQVFDWQMTIQGSRERILDSVLPHEITHTVFATHFRQPLPRWADEGACTTVEHHSEVAKQERMLIDFLRARPGHPGRGIPFNDMFAMKDYPQDVLPLYAQGHSLSVFLIGQRGKRAFLEFLSDGMTDENWRRAVNAHYGFEHLLALQNAWLDWVKAGRPALTPPADATMLAGGPPTAPRPDQAAAHVTAGSAAVFRGQSPEGPAAERRQANPSPPVTPTPADAVSSDWSTRPARHAAAWTPQPGGLQAGGTVYR
jgi:hypothetical protein